MTMSDGSCRHRDLLIIILSTQCHKDMTLVISFMTTMSFYETLCSRIDYFGCSFLQVQYKSFKHPETTILDLFGRDYFFTKTMSLLSVGNLKLYYYLKKWCRAIHKKFGMSNGQKLASVLPFM